MIRALLLFMVLSSSSCIQIGGEALPINYYLLESTATGNLSNQLKFQLELGQIDFPVYLDRPQIVTRDPDNRILIAKNHRWAEPLPDNLPRTLQENLHKLAPALKVASAPWNSATEPDYAILLTINRFDGILGQHAVADIRWRIIAQMTGEELLRQHYQFKQPITDDYQSLVNGLNRALAELSTDIITALNQQSR